MYRLNKELYEELNGVLESFFEDEHDWLANSANFAALLFYELDQINWCGFYFMKGGELVLGPFQGRPACVRITLGRGVCGTAAQKQETIVVADVGQFPGHITCDSNSKSEIVIPLIRNTDVMGVLDIDSPVINRFSDQERMYLERLAGTFLTGTDFNT